MQCVVTGAAGFIGSTLCEELLRLGHSVTGIDSFVDYYPRGTKEMQLAIARSHKNFQFIEGDLLTLDLSNCLRGAEWVFHQAAQAGVRASWGIYFRSYTDNNVLATQRLLEEARRHPCIKKIVYASSSSIYGDAESFPTSEHLTPRPVSPYGVTKLAAEHLMQLYATQFSLPTVSLRYFTVFGPRQRPDMAFHRFISSALRTEEIEVFGDGEQSRDFTFVTDIVEANILAAKHGSSGAVFNIGGGTQVTINQVLEMIELRLIDLGLDRLRVRRTERQAGDARRTSADTARARAELGFSPKVSLEEGLLRQIDSLRALRGG